MRFLVRLPRCRYGVIGLRVTISISTSDDILSEERYTTTTKTWENMSLSGRSGQTHTVYWTHLVRIPEVVNVF